MEEFNQLDTETQTALKIAEMLGSEGASRKALEEQVEAYREEPMCEVDYQWDLDLTVSTFHFLSGIVKYDADMDGSLQSLRRTEKLKSVDAPEAFMQRLVDRYGADVTGLYGDGDPMQVYLQNEESALDVNLGITYFEITGDLYKEDSDTIAVHEGVYIILQRSGYGGVSHPILFRLQDYKDGPEIFMYHRGTIRDDSGNYWITENAGYKWHRNGPTSNPVKRLDQCHVHTEESLREEAGGALFPLLLGAYAADTNRRKEAEGMLYKDKPFMENAQFVEWLIENYTDTVDNADGVILETEVDGETVHLSPVTPVTQLEAFPH